MKRHIIAASLTLAVLLGTAAFTPIKKDNPVFDTYDNVIAPSSPLAIHPNKVQDENIGNTDKLEKPRIDRNDADNKRVNAKHPVFENDIRNSIVNPCDRFDRIK